MKTICIMCPIGCSLNVFESNGSIDVTGNLCLRGKKYGDQEYIAPMRMVTTLMRTQDGDLISCKTSDTIPKIKVDEVIKHIKSITAVSNVVIGDILVENILNLGVNIVATSNKMRG